MTSEQRLDRLERILKLMVNAGKRERAKVNENHEMIKMLITAQIRTDDELNKMREESKAMRDDLYQHAHETFELFRLTDQRIARLTEAYYGRSTGFDSN
jgi:hypothetical protein